KGPDRLALMTDAMGAAAMPEGPSTLGSLTDGIEVLVGEGVAEWTERSSMAGSTEATDRLVRTMLEGDTIPLVDDIRMMTATPARILGVDRSLGTLVAGKEADIVLFDEHIDIKMTMVKGEVIYDSTAGASLNTHKEEVAS